MVFLRGCAAEYNLLCRCQNSEMSDNHLFVSLARTSQTAKRVMGTWDGDRLSSCRFLCFRCAATRFVPPFELLRKTGEVCPAIVAGHSGLNASKQHNVLKLKGFAVLQAYDSKGLDLQALPFGVAVERRQKHHVIQGNYFRCFLARQENQMK